MHYVNVSVMESQLICFVVNLSFSKPTSSTKKISFQIKFYAMTYAILMQLKDKYFYMSTLSVEYYYKEVLLNIDKKLFQDVSRNLRFSQNVAKYL